MLCHTLQVIEFGSCARSEDNHRICLSRFTPWGPNVHAMGAAGLHDRHTESIARFAHNKPNIEREKAVQDEQEGCTSSPAMQSVILNLSNA